MTSLCVEAERAQGLLATPGGGPDPTGPACGGAIPAARSPYPAAPANAVAAAAAAAAPAPTTRTGPYSVAAPADAAVATAAAWHPDPGPLPAERVSVHIDAPTRRALVTFAVRGVWVRAWVNHMLGLAQTCRVEEAEALLSRGHLCKRGLLLVRAWPVHGGRVLSLPEDAAWLAGSKERRASGGGALTGSGGGGGGGSCTSSCSSW